MSDWDDIEEDDWDDPPAMGWEKFAAWRLAGIFTASNWTPQAMLSAVHEALGPEWPREWLPRLVTDILEKSPTPYAPAPGTLRQLILDSRAFQGFYLETTENPALETFYEPRKSVV